GTRFLIPISSAFRASPVATSSKAANQPTAIPVRFYRPGIRLISCQNFREGSGPMEKSLSVAVPSSIARFLYTHNPFYLIGTLLVLYGAQQSLGQEPTLATSKLLMELLAGYTIALAAAAVLIIRWGQVWDDARTILLVIVLMFFMLSTSMDFHFLFTLEEPWPGTWLLAAGWAFSIAISELLLIGLGIRLGVSYRLAYHLILVLLFGYPMLLGWMNYYSHYGALPWALLGFPAAGAGVL